MKVSIFILFALALSGCGKSEIDKCVDAGMSMFDAECMANPLENPLCLKPGGRSNVEFGFRRSCLQAAGRN